MKRSDLPADLGPAFTVRDTAAQGVGGSRLRRSDLARPFRGMRVSSAPDLSALDAADRRVAEARQSALHCALVLSGPWFFSHVTAAILWGLPLPSRLFEPDGDDPAHVSRIDAGVFAGTRLVRRDGVRGHEIAARRAVVMQHPQYDVPITTPASTWATLSTVLGHHDLIAVGDAVVREQMFTGDPAPLANIADLSAIVASGRRVGIGRLREALPCIRTRSASRPETLLRMLLLDAGLPEAELNWTVRDERGLFVACVDQAYVHERVIVEYEGDHHRSDSRQWAKDIARYERLSAMGWIVIRVTKHDLFGAPQRTVARVRAALAARRNS